MGSSSRVETIFFTAIEKETGAARADYLEQACCGDAACGSRWNGCGRPSTSEGFPGPTRRRSSGVQPTEAKRRHPFSALFGPQALHPGPQEAQVDPGRDARWPGRGPE